MRFMLDLETMDKASTEARVLVLAHAVEAVISSNLTYLKDQKPPTLYASGVVYRPDSSFRDIPRVLFHGYADCKSLVAWRIAELRKQGQDARIHAVHYGSESADLVHLRVRVVSKTGSFKTEDPSERLGMKELR